MAHSATRRAGRTAARQLKPRPQAAPQVGLAQAADARPDGQLAQTLLPASARTTRHLPWAGDVIRQRKRQRGGAGAPPKQPKKAPPTDAAKGQERGELGGRLHVSTAHAHSPALCQADDVRADEDGRGRLRACDHHVHDCSSALARRAIPGRGCRAASIKTIAQRTTCPRIAGGAKTTRDALRPARRRGDARGLRLSSAAGCARRSSAPT